MLVNRKWISTAFGLLLLAASAPAFGAPPSRNQTMANAVADTLRQSPALSQSAVDIETRAGVVTLSGVVANPALKAEAIARTQSVPGVVSVIDRITVTDNGIRRAQFQPGAAPAQVAMGGHMFHHNAGAEPPIMMEGSYEGMPMETAAPAGPSYEGPAPEGPAGMVGATQASMPGQPNYAWPSYAPAPNFSAVGYPTVYPWQAWPNIGPFYPYPEVPLDWRAVTLRWDDGLWWLDFKKHYTRPFFTPYPFGIFGY